MEEKHAKNLLFLAPTQIVVSSTRGRKNFGNINTLMDSIQEHGLIHPIVVVKAEEEDKYILVAGERRYRAMCLLGWKALPCTDRESLSVLEAKSLELEENIKRENLSWEEEIELYRQIDEIKRITYGEKMQGASTEKGWSTEKTAELLGISRSNLYQQIQFATFLKDNPQYKKEIENLPLSAAIKKVGMLRIAEKNKRLQEQGKIKITANLILGDCVELIKDIKSDSIDLLLTDIPYGIKAVSEALDGKRVGKQQLYKGLIEDSDNLSKEEVVSLLEAIVPELQRVLKPSSHFYIFHSFAVYSELLTILRRNNFLPFDAPIIWDKGRTTNPFRGYEFATCYEPILYGHVPPKNKRFLLGGKLIVDSAPISPNLRMHPFEKPQELLRYFIRQSTNVGDKIIDPFAGSASTLIAAKALNRSCVGFEINSKNYHVTLERLKEK